eukprot:g14568.t1
MENSALPVIETVSNAAVENVAVTENALHRNPFARQVPIAQGFWEHWPRINLRYGKTRVCSNVRTKAPARRLVRLSTEALCGLVTVVGIVPSRARAGTIAA